MKTVKKSIEPKPSVAIIEQSCAGRTEETPDAPLAPEAVSSAITIPEATLDQLDLLGKHMAGAFGRYVHYNVHHGHKTREEAEAQALASPIDKHVQLILKKPHGTVTYMDLNKLQFKDPALAAQLFQEITQSARQSARNGENHFRAVSLNDEENVSQFARFDAVRAALSEGNEPRNGMESELLNQMVQYQILILQWTRILTERSLRDTIEEVGYLKKIRPPELSQAQSVEHAMNMVDRLQKGFLRAQRAFQDCRKQAPITVQHAAQVNLANQQLNVVGERPS